MKRQFSCSQATPVGLIFRLILIDNQRKEALEGVRVVPAARVTDPGKLDKISTRSRMISKGFLDVEEAAVHQNTHA